MGMGIEAGVETAIDSSYACVGSIAKPLDLRRQGTAAPHSTGE